MTEDMKNRFLCELAKIGDWKAASLQVGKSRNTTHGWRRKDSDFAVKAADALGIWRGIAGQKKCRKCSEVRSTDCFEFRSDRQSYRAVCNTCRSSGQRRRYETYRKKAWFLHKATRARTRSKWLGVPFDLDSGYLESIWTGFCPISGIHLDKDATKGDPNYPELDRRIPKKGYVKGNVTFLCSRMNNIKRDATLEEVTLLYNWMIDKAGGNND